MKWKLSLMLLVLIGFSMSVYAESSEDESIDIMGVTLSYFSGEFEVKNVYVITGFPTKESQYSTHILNIENKKGKNLYSVKFSIGDVHFSPPDEDWFDEDGNQIFIPEFVEQEVSETIFVPYFEDGYYIVVEDLEGNEILRDNIPKWFGVIPDDIEYEVVLDDEEIVGDEKKEGIWIWIYLVSILIIVVICIIGILYLIRVNKSNDS